MTRTRYRWWPAFVAAAALAVAQAVGMGVGISAAHAAGPTAIADTVPAVMNGSAMELGTYNPSNQLRLVVGLTPPHPQAEQQFLDALQNKSSPLYHHYLTQQQWTDRFGPSAADEQAVVGWAKSAGLTVAQRYPNRLVVDLVGSVATIQKALHVQLNNYRLGSDTFFANNVAPTVPPSLAGIVQSIGGLDSFHRMVPASATTAPHTADFSAGPVVATGGSGHLDGSQSALAAARRATAAKLAKAKAGGAGPNITGNFYDPTDIYSSQAYDLNALYNQGLCCNPFHVSGGTPKETSIAIATLGAHNDSDFTGFHNSYPYLAEHWFTINVDGTPTCCDFEGTMDFDWATAWSNSFGSFADTSSVFMYDGATNFQSTFTDIYNTIVSRNETRVMSTSWACGEPSGGANPCDSGTRNTQHNIFNNMVGMGWSLVAASGDRGAYGNCQNVGVMYPASDPNVVAAGGTELTLFNGPVYGGEVAWSGSTAANSCNTNNGGSTGGCSIDYAAPSYQGSAYPCGSGSRSVPDIALNASFGQNTFFNGSLTGGAGTSIVAPEFAGFLAQKNAYGVFLGSICGLGQGNQPCAPLGQANPTLYQAMQGLAPHAPAYDITSGCNGNDIGGGYCAGTGYDLVTGFGSFNALQLAWALNWRTVAESTPPSVIYSGPSTNTWFNSDQTVFWAVTDSGGNYPASGVSGYTSGWDAIPTDPSSHATPGTGDSFYAGPARPEQSGGSLNVSAAGQGCHTVHVRGWDNMGASSGDTTYGPVCYDSVAPTVTLAPKPTLVKKSVLTASGIPIQLTWAGADATSGVSYYSLYQSTDGGAFSFVSNYTGTSATLSLASGHAYRFEIFATDRAGNTSVGALGTAFKLTLFQEYASRLVYTGTWASQSLTGASAGAVKYTTARNATVKLPYTGFQVAWVSTVGSNRGSATVSVDGGSATTVNANGTTLQPAAILFVKNTTAGSHTLLVKNLATSGHPRTDVDAFVVLS